MAVKAGRPYVFVRRRDKYNTGVGECSLKDPKGEDRTAVRTYRSKGKGLHTDHRTAVQMTAGAARALISIQLYGCTAVRGCTCSRLS